jgi:hypothetical protein
MNIPVMRLKTIMLLTNLALLLSAAQSQNLSFNLTPSVQSGVGSNEVVFTGVITNTGSTTNYLNNIQITFTNPATNYLAADTNVFFANVPGILLPGETYTDVVFGIAIRASTPRGNYTGIMTIQGGTNIFAGANLTNQAFQISLSPASLSVASAGTNLVFSWPSPPGGFVLQQISDLTTTNWTTATNMTATNYQNLAILPATTNGSRFYRLQYQ